MPIQRATEAAPPAPPLLGALPPDAHRRVSTPAAFPEIYSPSEVGIIESVERFSHTDGAREHRTEPVCDAAIRNLLLASLSVPLDEFLLHLVSHQCPPRRVISSPGVSPTPPFVGSALFGHQTASLHRQRRRPPPRAEANAPSCSGWSGQAWKECRPRLIRPTYAKLRSAAHASVD